MKQQTSHLRSYFFSNSPVRCLLTKVVFPKTNQISLLKPQNFTTEHYYLLKVIRIICYYVSHTYNLASLISHIKSSHFYTIFLQVFIKETTETLNLARLYQIRYLPRSAKSLWLSQGLCLVVIKLLPLLDP